MVRWLESRPQLRPLILAALAAVLLLGGAAYVARSGGPSVAKPAPSNPNVQGVQVTPPPVATAPTPGSIQGGPGEVTPTRQADQAFLTARAPATAFLEAYASYHWDDTPQVVRARLRPYDTDSLDAALANDSGSGAVGVAQAQSHEVAWGHVVEMGPQTLDDGKLTVIATLRDDITNDQGKTSRSYSVVVLMVQTSNGWRADQVRV